MRFDYGGMDWRFVARILNENSLRLSRTRHGVSDTSTSPAKQVLLLEGEALRQRSAANEQQAHQFVFETRHDPPPRTAADVLALLWAVADRTNDGLLPAGALRTWDIGPPPDSALASGLEPKVAPADLPTALQQFAATVLHRWGELAADPVPLAAWAEWQLNGGRLHPFYDGCGRISRCFGALLLLRASWLLPLYDRPAPYFDHGNRGPEAFAAYVHACIDRCARCAR